MERRRAPSPGKLSRRGFLEGVACLAAGDVLVSASAPGAPAAESDSPALLIDAAACRNCGDCLKACAGIHDGSNPGEFWSNVIMVHGRDGGRNALAVPARCMQCADPSCVAVCRGSALTKTQAGPVVLDQEKCVGCLWCTQVCPFEGSLHYDPAQRKVFKCDMCYGRISEGAKLPCVGACDEKGFHVFTSGPFDQILQLGRKRAREIDGVLLYPEATKTLMLIPREEFGQPAIRNLLGFTEAYPAAARIKAGASRWVHLGWLPVLGGLGFCVVNWRRNTMEELVRIQKKDEQP